MGGRGARTEENENEDKGEDVEWKIKERGREERLERKEKRGASAAAGYIEWVLLFLAQLMLSSLQIVVGMVYT